MNPISRLALLLLASWACHEGPRPTSDELLVAAASANPMTALASTAEVALRAVSLEQDTARTVTRRIWPDAHLYALAADGRLAAAIDWSTGNLAIRDMETGEVRLLTHNTAPYEPGEAEGAAISPDGKWVAYSWYDFDEPAYYKLGVVDIEGRNPRIIYSDLATEWIEPVDWSPDGQWILASRQTGGRGRAEILLVSARDGSVRLVKTIEDAYPNRDPASMSFSPDGRYIAYDLPRSDVQDRDIFLVDVMTGEERALVTHPAVDQMLGWAPDGRHVLFRSDRSGTPGAWLLPVADGKPSGTPWLVKPDMWRTSGLGFTDDGRYFYTVNTAKRDVFVATFDPDSRSVVGAPTAITQRSHDNSSNPTWSPDGRHLAYIAHRSQTNAVNRVMVHSMETGDKREFKLDVPGWIGHRGWTPDGRSLLVFASNPALDEENDVTVYRLDIQTGHKELLRTGPGPGLPYPATAPEPEFSMYVASQKNHEGQAAFRILRAELATGDTTVLYQTPYGPWGQIMGERLSPDGRTLAFSYRRERLLLLPVNGGEATELPIDDVVRIAWMPDGEALLLQRFVDVGPIWDVWYLDLSEGEPQPIGLITHGTTPGLDVHPDGRSITYASGKGGAELWVMENFLPIR